MFVYLFKYAWFVLGLLVLVQILFLLFRVNSIAARAGDTPERVRNFLLVYALYFSAPYFVFGALQVLGGFENAFYIFFAPLDNIFILLATAFIFIWWAIGAYLIFFRDGAAYLIRHDLLGHRMPASPRFIKIFIVGVPFLWIIVMSLGRGLPGLTAPR